MRRRILLLLLSLIGFAASGRAQVTGSIVGTIRDASGGVLPGATITVSGPALQRENLTTVTADNGTYRVTPLPPGRYDVLVVFSGFNPQVQRDVEVGINQEVTLDLNLSLAAIGETIDVKAETPMVAATRSDLTSRVSTETIDTLPLNGRNFEDLIALVAGAKPEPAGQQGADVSIFGERGTAISFVLDGGDNNDPVNGGALQRLSQDSIQEFEVITTGYQAEFGRAQGGVINIVSRSGTNRSSGSAFLFIRDDSLDSSNVEEHDCQSAQISATAPGSSSAGSIPGGNSAATAAGSARYSSVSTSPE